MQHIAAAIALLVLGGEPQCPTDPPSCRASILPGLRFDYSGRNNDQICNTTTWMVYDYCDKLCPMRLVITDPPELRTWMCAHDNKFEPYSPDAHIDLYHPLNNKELELQAVGHPDLGDTENGCAAEDYASSGKNFTGKIVLGRRGKCLPTAQARQAKASGAAMLFLVDFWGYYTWRSYSGSTRGIEDFPMMSTARHEADYILDALRRNVTVKGKFQYECNDMPAGYLDNPQDYPWDKCGDNYMALRDTCTNLENEQEPLCEVCTVELQLPGGGEKLCLFGNDLRPRKRETLLDFSPSWQLPYVAAPDEVVYASNIGNASCNSTGFAAMAGKIVLVPETSDCPLIQTVRNAQQAGVKAYILVSEAPYTPQWYRVRAYSHHVTIPVHTVDYHAAPKLRRLITDSSTPIPASHPMGYGLGEVTLSRGLPPPRKPVTPAPPRQAVVDDSPQPDTSSDFEMSAGTVVCIVVICVDVILLVVIFVRQRRNSVQLPEEVQPTSFTIPLKVASMGLSLTLLMLIAVVSFSLATMAGQDSTDQAMDNGRFALGLAYDSSELNTIELSDTIRSNVIDRMLAALQKEILSMEYKLKVAENIFFGFDGTWQAFELRYLTLVRMMRNADTSTEEVRFQIFTTNGFFMNSHYKTDNRTDDLRNDGVVGAVAETQQGWRYGVNSYSLNYGTRTLNYKGTTPPYQYNASMMLAGNIGDPLAATQSRPLGDTVWIAAKLAYPVYFHSYHPMAAYRPLYSGSKFVGTLEVHNELSDFIGTALDTSELSSSSLRNVSVMVLDVDRSILGSYNIGTGESQIEAVVALGSLRGVYGVYYMHRHPTIRVTAFANYLDKVGGWRKHAGGFDQKDHFTTQDYLTLANINVANGRAADIGVHNWDVEMRDGACGDCVVHDDQLQKDVMVFDGGSALHVYRNLTHRAPIVAANINKTAVPWSNIAAFNNNMTLPDGTTCVSNTWNTTATEGTTQCLLRPDFSELTSYMVSFRVRPDVAYAEPLSVSTPRLFTDSMVGDANIRMFANGEMHLSVLRYGCRTKAYKGGLPVGAWTTLTASIGSGYCRMYVNGTLYAYGIDARGTKRRHHGAYRVGHRFKGRMDNLQLFRYRMSRTEILGIHTKGKLVRNVQSKQYFSETKTLYLNTRSRSGVNWAVAVMIPRDDIMRVVDANRRETLSDVQIQDDNTKKELTQRANATIMIIVAIGMTSVVVFLVFNNMMTRPFEETAAIMAEAAVLRIDAVPQGRSLITELGAMNAAMRLMLENLKLYKSFMPQSVQLDDSPDETDGCDVMVSDTRSTMTGTIAAVRAATSSHVSSSRSARTSGSGPRQAEAQKRHMQCSLSKKRFSFLVLNVRKWHETTAGFNNEEVLSLHSRILEAFLQKFGLNKGVAEVFSGDRFACTFNAAKAASQHRFLTCVCAEQCSIEASQANLSLSAAAVSGDGRVGNMGTSSMRRYSLMSPVITWGYALERFCSADKGLNIMMDHIVCGDADQAFSVRLTDAIAFPKLKVQVLRVFELVSRKRVGETDEWMYELRQAEANDPMLRWNAAAVKVVNNNFDDPDEMKEVLSQCDEKSTLRIREAFTARRFEPFHIPFH